MGEKKNINFAWPVTTLCKYDYEALRTCIKENEKLFKQKEIVIFGAGIRGTAFSLLLKKFGYNNIVFTDNNEKKVGAYINEFFIIPYSEVVEKKGNIIVLISVENGFVLKEQLEESGFAENIDYFYIESHLYEKYLEQFLDKRKIETLIMGDCGLTDLSKQDENFTNLGEMLAQNLGEDKTKVLAVHAMGMRAYYHILSVQIKYITVPKCVVIMANFETFTGKQHLLPRSQHARLIEMISKAINDKDIELNEYRKITKERFENFKLDYFASSQGTVKQMSKDKNDRIVIKINYMYDLKLDNEGILYMKKIMELCSTYGIDLLFFIPPANYMYAVDLYGDAFTERYQSNVMKLKSIFEDENAELLDLSYVLKSEQFADIHTIDETANYEGRKIVTAEIVKKINMMENGI